MLSDLLWQRLPRGSAGSGVPCASAGHLVSLGASVSRHPADGDRGSRMSVAQEAFYIGTGNHAGKTGRILRHYIVRRRDAGGRSGDRCRLGGRQRAEARQRGAAKNNKLCTIAITTTSRVLPLKANR